MNASLQHLDNGLRVVVLPRPRTAVATVWLWVQAGAADEHDTIAGAAHLLEHMLFKGTPRYALGEASSRIEQCGGDLNAYTTWDHTVLHASVVSSHWKTTLDVIADMATEAVIDPDELERERSVVLDEIRSYDDDVSSAVHDRLRKQVWGNHPYGRPVLGTADTVSTLSAADLRAFYHAHWGPKRAIVVVAGDVAPEAVKREVERRLGSWTGGGQRAQQTDSTQPNEGRIEVHTGDFLSPEVQMGWRVPGCDHPDAPALMLLAAAIGQGGASPMTLRLQLETGLASEPWATYDMAAQGGTFLLGFSPDERSTREAIDEALDLVHSAVRGGLSGARIRKSRDALLAQYAFDDETVDGLAADAAFFTCRHGSPQQREQWRASVAALTATDVSRVAARWLGLSSAQIVAADPRWSGPRLRKAIHRPAPPLPVARDTGLVRHTLSNGIRLLVLPDDSAVAAIRVSSIGGLRSVGPRQAGLAAGWAEMVQAGCGPWDAVSYRQAADDMAAQVGAWAGPSTSSLTATLPADDLESGLALLGEALTDPHFDPAEWHRVRDELLEEVRTVDDRAHEVAEQALDERLWARHPWRLPYAGTPDSLRRLKETSIQRWHRSQFAPHQTVAVVTGGVDPDLTLQRMERWLGQLRVRRGAREPDLPEAAQAGHFTVHAGKTQGIAQIALRTPAAQHPHRRALELAAACLDGPGGRLFMDLRERRALGYDTWAEHSVGVDGGAMRLGVTCHPDRLTEAGEALIEQWMRLAESGPTRSELERCRAFLNGSLALALQRASARATRLALCTLFGRDWRPESLMAERARVQPQDVQQALEALGPQNLVRVDVRPL